jgi:hypothetical protein
VNDEGEKVSSENSQDAANRGADQPLQADSPEPPFKQNDGQTENRAYDGVGSRVDSEGINAIAGDSNKEDEKKTYED